MTASSASTASPLDQKPASLGLTASLMVYLLFVAGGATSVIIANFSVHDPQNDPINGSDKLAQSTPVPATPKPATPKPATPVPATPVPADPSPDVAPDETSSFLSFRRVLQTREQILILLALCGGIAGSFIHAAQSLVSYVGNRSFVRSWAAWYFLRPWIGGTLGMTVYFVLQAGLLGGGSAVNPHGVVALGILGGWFSKTASDKMQEVFETLFKSNEDKKRADKLTDFEQPKISEIDPNPASVDVDKISVLGLNFIQGAVVQLGDFQMPTDFLSDTKLEFSLSKLPDPPASGSIMSLSVRNPQGPSPLSESREIKFEWAGLRATGVEEG